MSDNDTSGYVYSDADLNQSHGFLLPPILKILKTLALSASEKRLFELGCGNGSVAHELTMLPASILLWRALRRHAKAVPDFKLQIGSAYDDLAGQYGQFSVVLSLEVVEHIYAPRHYARTLFELTAERGTAIVSTPYRGYWKNLALAASGRMDMHFTALWDNGHIKFWSIATLGELLKEAGFVDVRFVRVGRVPVLTKSMIAIARKP